MLRPSSPTRALLVGLVAVTACSKSNVITTNNNNTTINNITQTVGPSGAHLESPGGAILDIPPGALTADVDISIGEIDLASAPAVPSELTPRSAVFAFQPHGQTFALEVTLTLPHRAGSPANVRVYRADPGGAWAPFPSEPPTANRVQVVTRGFSLYVVGEVAGGGPVDAGVVPFTDATAPNGCASDDACGSGAVCRCPNGLAPPCPDPGDVARCQGDGSPDAGFDCTELRRRAEAFAAEFGDAIQCSTERVCGGEWMPTPGCRVATAQAADTERLQLEYSMLQAELAGSGCDLGIPTSVPCTTEPALGSRCVDPGPDGQGQICQFITECSPDACVSDLATTACGGMPTGMWDVTGTCSLIGNMAMQACPTATFTGTTAASGRLSLAGAGSYALDALVVGTGTITVPQPCNQFGCTAIQGFLAGAYETVRCSDDGGGGCRCLTTTRDRRNETGTWTVNGTELVFTSTAAPGGRRVWFSASDTVMLMQERVGPGMLPPPPLRLITSGP